MESDSEFTDAPEFIPASPSNKVTSVPSESSSMESAPATKTTHPASPRLEHVDFADDPPQNGHQTETPQVVNGEVEPSVNLIDFDFGSSEKVAFPEGSLCENRSPPKAYESFDPFSGAGLTRTDSSSTKFSQKDILSEFDDLHLGQELDTKELAGEFGGFGSQGDLLGLSSEVSGFKPATSEWPTEPQTSDDFGLSPQDSSETSLEEDQPVGGEPPKQEPLYDDVEPEIVAEEPGPPQEDEFNGFADDMDHAPDAFDDFDDDFAPMSQANGDADFGDDFDDDFAPMNQAPDGDQDFGDDFDDFAEAEPVKDNLLSGLVFNDPEMAKEGVAKILADVYPVSSERDHASANTGTRPCYRPWDALLGPSPQGSFKWVRSQIRRDFLISLNIPINLDEIYTRRASVLKIDSPAVLPGSGPIDEFDIAMARSLCNLSEETIRNYPANDLTSLLDQLTSLSKQTNAYFEFWVKQHEKVKAEAEAIHKTIECMVSHAQKNREKQSGESKWFKKRISGISKATSPRNSASIDVARRRLSM
ncbi:hypothetical protein K493DRAFT_410139 [Basidiobolus meristosporus CBS 931.73]|uniref:Uncharacterized protein n=1 Tax=Basidiobolus meristosporus CBS 931.73 TaxID=1314790 RepID=A0A1Y1XVY0_9FUNG|nr:hypothetical protein K493DRAFT_410139 [Basidiobolus meristosporus CBS 931.73]|eukprot:ORX89918.1 hypothetical protein K493DRAFT_410139 [Basidiobolus meristosporus CBS 931.73]